MPPTCSFRETEPARAGESRPAIPFFQHRVSGLILPNRAREPLLNFQTDCGTRPVSDKDLHRVATSCNYMRKVPQLCRIRSLKAVSAGLQGRVSLVFSVPLNKHGDCLRKPVSGRHYQSGSPFACSTHGALFREQRDCDGRRLRHAEKQRIE